MFFLSLHIPFFLLSFTLSFSVQTLSFLSLSPPLLSLPLSLCPPCNYRCLIPHMIYGGRAATTPSPLSSTPHPHLPNPPVHISHSLRNGAQSAVIMRGLPPAAVATATPTPSLYVSSSFPLHQLWSPPYGRHLLHVNLLSMDVSDEHRGESSYPYTPPPQGVKRTMSPLHQAQVNTGARWWWWGGIISGSPAHLCQCVHFTP